MTASDCETILVTVAEPPVIYLMPTVTEVADELKEKGPTKNPESLLFVETVQVGAAENIPPAIVRTHAPDETFPIEDNHEPDWLVIEELDEHVTIALSTRSAPAEPLVTLPTRIGAF